jgi:hypothetical protein
MRWDNTDAQYDGTIYNDWMKGSIQGTSLRDIVIVPSCLAYAIFQRTSWCSGGVVHINDATGDTKGRMLWKVCYDRWHMRRLAIHTRSPLNSTSKRIFSVIYSFVQFLQYSFTLFHLYSQRLYPITQYFISIPYNYQILFLLFNNNIVNIIAHHNF